MAQKLTPEKIATIPEELLVEFTVKHIGSDNTTDVKWVMPGRKELKAWRASYKQGGDDYAKEVLVRMCCVSHDETELVALMEMRPALEDKAYASLLEVMNLGVEQTKKASSPAKS